MRFVGNQREYRVKTAEPFVYGRVSVLYKTDDGHGNALCLKLFPRALRDRGDADRSFLREVAGQGELQHPNILPVLDSGVTKGRGRGGAFLVLPFCSGGDLRKVLRGRDFVPVSEALPILEGVAAGLDHSHFSGILHGDIKPENILFETSKAAPRLSDFGLSKHFSIKAESYTPTPELAGVPRSLPGESKTTNGGTAPYLSPEQISRGEQSSASDMYSFALVAYEMLTGQLPFNIWEPPFQQMRAKVEDRLIPAHERNTQLSIPVSKALAEGLSLYPSDRPTTARQFCARLRHAHEQRDEERPASHSRLPSSSAGRTGIFISYSHSDARWVKRLREHLKPLERMAEIDLWDDSRIRPGEKWREAISGAIENSRIAILLVSASYLASDFVASDEIPKLLEESKKKGLVIFQLIVSPCRFQQTPNLADFQALNPPNQTLLEMSAAEQQRTFVRLTEAVHEQLTLI